MAIYFLIMTSTVPMTTANVMARLRITGNNTSQERNP